MPKERKRHRAFLSIIYKTAYLWHTALDPCAEKSVGEAAPGVPPIYSTNAEKSVGADIIRPAFRKMYAETNCRGGRPRPPASPTPTQKRRTDVRPFTYSVSPSTALRLFPDSPRQSAPAPREWPSSDCPGSCTSSVSSPLFSPLRPLR